MWTVGGQFRVTVYQQTTKNYLSDALYCFSKQKQKNLQLFK